LEIVKLRGNKLTEIQFLQAKTITSLDLGANAFVSFPSEIISMDSLQELLIDQNKLNAIPDAFSKLQMIGRLDISTNAFPFFPEIICSLTRLKELRASANKFSSLPSCFSSLTQLTDLDLGKNAFTAIPSMLGKMQALSTIDFSDNKIKQVFDELSAWKHKVEIKMWGNGILREELAKFPDGELSQYVTLVLLK